MSCCVGGINIFSTSPGRLVVVDEGASPVTFAVDGNKNTFRDLKAIVTSVGYQAQGGFQFMHALREFVYVYVFTERVGEIIVTGLAFPAVCSPIGPQDDSQDPACVHGLSGLERVLTWYDCNRITTRAAPISIVFGLTGEVAYQSFLVGMKADITDPSTGIAQFTMRFNFIPNISDSDDFCFETEFDCLNPPCGPQGPQG